MMYHSFFKPDEYFSPLPGYNDEYQISNYACIYDTRFNTLKLDSPLIQKDTYRSVVLRRGDGVCQVLVHKIMGLTFLPNPYHKKVINHKDRNKRNNSISNLEWATHSENSAHWHHYEIAKARLINSGDKVIVNRLLSEHVVVGKWGNKYLDFGHPINFQPISGITDPRELEQGYEIKLQDMIKVISLEMANLKIKRQNRKDFSKHQRLKAKFEGK